MNIRAEIQESVEPEILTWLLNMYPMQSAWKFVARPVFKRYGSKSYQVERTWEPTEEGRIIYEHFHKKE